MNVAVLILLVLGLQLAQSRNPAQVLNRQCIHPPCDYTTVDVDGVLHDGTFPVPGSVIGARSLGGFLGGFAPLAAATSDLLAGVATLGFAANRPYYYPYGGYGGGFGGGYGYGPYAPGPGYLYGGPFRPFPYFR